MKHKAFLALLDFPSPLTGNIFPLQVVEEAIERSRLKIDGRLLTGSLFDDLSLLNVDLTKKNLAPEEIESLVIRRNLHYFRCKANNISHVITDLYTEKDNWIAEIETLPTGKGLKLEALLNREKHSEELVKFRPVIVREDKGGIVSTINHIISIDAVVREV